MDKNLNYSEVVVIGGGPSGSTVASLLSRRGISVNLFEMQKFPRFHIGESLLPGSLPIFKELGVQEQFERSCIKKPGGKWYYGSKPATGNFNLGPKNSNFKDTPYAFMVKREEFDDILLKNSSQLGVNVYQNHKVTDIIQENGKVIGVIVLEPDGNIKEYRCDMVFDCSGFGAILPKKFKLRKENRLKTMAVFGHFRTQVYDQDVKNGWFVGQLIYNGWIWMIPLKKDLLSVGVVITLDEYKNAQQSPQAFLEKYMRNIPITKNGIEPNPVLEGKVKIYGNLGYTTTRAHGDGWALVGDAAFFIDPCYSSGVHLALSTAKFASETYLKARTEKINQVEAFAKYEKFLRKEEKVVLRFVDSFYMASRNRFLMWATPLVQGNIEFIRRAFVGIVGGNFAEHTWKVNFVYYISKLTCFLLPFSAKKINLMNEEK